MPQHEEVMPRHAKAVQKRKFQVMPQHALFMLRHGDDKCKTYFWKVGFNAFQDSYCNPTSFVIIKRKQQSPERDIIIYLGSPSTKQFRIQVFNICSLCSFQFYFSQVYQLQLLKNYYKVEDLLKGLFYCRENSLLPYFDLFLCLLIL